MTLTEGGMSNSKNMYSRYPVCVTFEVNRSEEGIDFDQAILDRLPSTRFHFYDVGLLLYIATHEPGEKVNLTCTGDGPDRLKNSLKRLQATGLIHIGDSYGQTIYVKNKIPEALRWEVFECDNFTCQHCGCRRHLSADHIIPESKGGQMTLENLQTLCKPCNSAKGAQA